MTLPKGKVSFNDHYLADRKRARLIHVAAMVSALIVTAIFLMVQV